MNIPRPYQSEAVENIRNLLVQGFRRPILQLPTGAGKTFVAAMIIRLALGKGKRVLFLAPRRELIYQASRAFSENGIHNGVIMAGERSRVSDVQVASYQTLYRRGVQDSRMDMPDVDFLIVDEAHLAITESYQKILNHYSGKVVIGLTATPARGDGRGLDEVFDSLVSPISIRQLTDDGFLCPVRYFAPSEPDLSSLKVRSGDYLEKDLSGVMDKKSIIGDIVENWKRIASNKKTVVFCVTQAHGRHVCEEFQNAGIKAEHVDSETPKDERAAILKRVESGETQVVTNVFVMSYGLDIPSLECAVLARPTKNISLYLQTVGRILRTCEEKSEAIVIDHSGAVKENGFVDDEIPWSLEFKSTVKERKEKLQTERQEPKDIICSDCGEVYRSRRTCPSCGFQSVPESEPIPVYKADLQEIQRQSVAEGKKANRTETWDQKVNFIGQLKAYAVAKGYAKGWVAHKYKDKYGVFPNDPRVKNAPLSDIDAEVKNWIKHQAIKRAKSKKIHERRKSRGQNLLQRASV